MAEEELQELREILKEQTVAYEQIGAFLSNHYFELEERDTYNHWVNTWLGHKLRIEKIKKLLEQYDKGG